MTSCRFPLRPRRLAALGAGALLALATPALVDSALINSAQAAPDSRPTPKNPDSRKLQLTPEAQRAGLQPGNARMGWRNAVEAQQQRGMAPRSARSTYTPTGVLGIDVASYQGYVDWSSWKAKGKRFAYVKATEGSSYKNPYFSSQYDGAAKTGLIRGAYHFGNPSGQAGYLQARYFVANGGRWTAKGGQTLPGVLDIEYNPYGSTCYGLSASKMVSWISSFTREYKKLTGKDAVIYTTADWWGRCTGNTTKFTSTNPLWVARYGTTSPGKLPGSWRFATFWQYSATSIDQDRFSSSYTQLKVLATKI